MTRKTLPKDAKLGAEIENDWKLKQEEENWLPEDEVPTKPSEKN